jgi:hypothetical protein
MQELYFHFLTCLRAVVFSEAVSLDVSSRWSGFDSRPACVGFNEIHSAMPLHF